MKKIGVVLVLACLWPSLVLAESRIFISQVQITGGPGKTAEDFVELFNPSGTPVNINGYRLVKRTETGTSDTLIKSWITDIYIPARSFYLWANSGFSTINAVPDVTTSGTLSDNNGVALRYGENDSGVIVDSIAWGSANNSFVNVSAENPGAGSSLSRQDLYAENSAFTIATSSPRNTAVQDVIAMNTSTPSTVSSSSTPETSTISTPEYLTQSTYVRIIRFLPNPSGSDSGREWVELQNSDEQDVLLDGWMIDDSDTGTGPGSDAYVLSGVIRAGEIVRFVLPEGSFALNNSGGDEVNLYFADQSLSQKAAYSVSAYDDGIFEFRDGQWQPPAQAVSNTNNGGSSGTSNTSSVSSSPLVEFKFNEIFPNPTGDDAGKEWVEIYNPKNSTSSLEGYYIAHGQAEAWSATAWAVPKGYEVPPLGFLAVVLPKTSFSISNSGSEKLKLFTPDKYLLDSVIFKDAPENRSWAKNVDGVWEWGLPTRNLPNETIVESPKIYISELLPSPAGDEQEFVEIFNFGSEPVNLEGVVLQVGNKSKTFSPGESIPQGGYFLVWEDDLPGRLSNSGQTVRMLDPFGRPLSEVVYGKATAGESYATIDGKEFTWTSNTTPGNENLYVLGASTEKALVEKKTTAAVSRTTASNFSRSDIDKLLASNELMQERIASLEQSVDRLSQQVSYVGPGSTGQADAASDQELSETGHLGNKYLGLTFGALGLLAIIFLRFKFSAAKGSRNTEGG